MSDTPKRRRSPEWAFQSWCDRFIDRVVLPPMFVTGIDHASQSTDNARARMSARGVKFGLPDIYVAQSHRSAWLELKRGSSVSPSQIAVHNAMRKAGIYVTVCRTMQDVLLDLYGAGFNLHPNAKALADEYEMRVAASEKAPPKPRAVGVKAARKPRPTAGAIKRAHRFNVARGLTK